MEVPLAPPFCLTGVGVNCGFDLAARPLCSTDDTAAACADSGRSGGDE